MYIRGNPRFYDILTSVFDKKEPDQKILLLDYDISNSGLNVLFYKENGLT